MGKKCQCEKFLVKDIKVRINESDGKGRIQTLETKLSHLCLPLLAYFLGYNPFFQGFLVFIY